METLSFHVRHEVLPERTYEVLSCIAYGNDYKGITQYDRQLARLNMLGWIGKDRTHLTPLGQTVLAIIERFPLLSGEIGHFLHYSQWGSSTPEESTPFFLYRVFCNYLYDQQSTVVLNIRETLERTCLDLADVIQNSGHFPSEKLQGLSLSPDSLGGIIHWLKALNPPVITEDHFERRGYCPPETLLLAIGYALRDDPDALDVDILLSAELQEDICRACLLDPDYFEQTLDWMLPLYPDIITSDNEIGYYGRYIRLHKRPTLEDILR